MNTWTRLGVVSLLLGFGCGDGGDRGLDLAQGTTEIVSDTRVLKEAQAAANRLIRNAADCEAVKTNFAEAKSKLEEAAAKVQTSTGRTTLAALRKQVRTVGEACGVR